MQNLTIDDIIKLIEKGDFSKLYFEKKTEKDLFEIASGLKLKEIENINNIFCFMCNNVMDEYCDWNIGSILQHFHYNLIIENLNKVSINKKPYLYESIGLAWALGETNIKNNNIIEFLYDVLNYTRNSEAWWKAAFSIEKLNGKNAINNLKRSLKKSGLKDLKNNMLDLSDKKNVVGLLFHANSMEIKNTIYPELKKQFFSKKSNSKTLLNILWLFGRLRLFDVEIYKETIKMLENTDEYELIYYIFNSMSEDPKKLFYEEFLKRLNDDDPLIRKMALRGLSKINTNIDIEILEIMLQKEKNVSVIGEITRAIYIIKNRNITINEKLLSKYIVNENGLIGDDTDKWYADAGIYNIFSESEDVENICFNLINRKLKDDNIEIINPIDLATGTGRTTKNILNNIQYKGKLYSVDLSKHMLDYLQRTINR